MGADSNSVNRQLFSHHHTTLHFVHSPVHHRLERSDGVSILTTVIECGMRDMGYGIRDTEGEKIMCERRAFHSCIILIFSSLSSSALPRASEPASQRQCFCSGGEKVARLCVFTLPSHQEDFSFGQHDDNASLLIYSRSFNRCYSRFHRFYPIPRDA